MCVPGLPTTHLDAHTALDAGGEAVAMIRIAGLFSTIQPLLSQCPQVKVAVRVQLLGVLQLSLYCGQGQGVPGDHEEVQSVDEPVVIKIFVEVEHKTVFLNFSLEMLGEVESEAPAQH